MNLASSFKSTNATAIVPTRNRVTPTSGGNRLTSSDVEAFSLAQPELIGGPIAIASTE